MRDPTTVSTPRPQLVIDAAGGAAGGAESWLRALQQASLTESTSIKLIGQGRQLSPLWLLEREQYERGAYFLATNSLASPFRARSRQTLLLRNALHFVHASDNLPPMGSWGRSRRREAFVIRAAARFAGQIVVPSCSMRERVVTKCPNLSDRIYVLHHPVVAPRLPYHQTSESGDLVLFCPLMGSPYRRLDQQLLKLLDSVSSIEAATQRRIAIRITAPLGGSVIQHEHYSRVVMELGRLNSEGIEQEYARSNIVFYPSTFESFGYPMAEARVRGLPVVGLESPLLSEIAAEVAFPYDNGQQESLINAVLRAAAHEISMPITNPFDPSEYFSKLVGLATNSPRL